MRVQKLIAMIDRKPLVPVFLFFALLLVVGLIAFKDYGISWDEGVQRQYGERVYRYITQGDERLFLDRHRYYGPVIEGALYSLEQVLGLDDTRDVYLMRHLTIFLIFWAGVIFFYLLCRDELKSWRMGIIGSTFLILSPRIFAHSFYNSKDIPFLVMFIIGVYTLTKYLNRKTLFRAAIHGFACAVLIDIRIVGVLLPALTVLFLVYEIIGRARMRSDVGKIFLSLVVYVAVTVPVTILLWPTLWRDALHNFLRIFEGMRNFPWEATILYLGSYIWSTKLPWHYIPVWIGVSTPITYLVLFAFGTFIVIRSLFAEPPSVPARRTGLLILAWLFLPVLFSIVSGAVLYDAWRHTFFVYPALLLLALVGLRGLWRSVSTRGHGGRSKAMAWGIVILVVLNLATTCAFMVRYHPHQNVYFNALAGGVRGAESRFELDYWGLSYRKTLEHILKLDRGQYVRIHAATAPGRYNADILPDGDRKRLVFLAEPYRAQYLITNFRWERGRDVPGPEIYAVKIDGVKIAAVYEIPGM
jgi:hypothetical protein